MSGLLAGLADFCTAGGTNRITVDQGPPVHLYPVGLKNHVVGGFVVTRAQCPPGMKCLSGFKLYFYFTVDSIQSCSSIFQGVQREWDTVKLSCLDSILGSIVF